MMRNKRIYIYLGIAIIIITLFRYNLFERQVIKEMDNCVIQKRELIFQNINGDFDSLLILQPYTNIKRLKAELNISLKSTGIDLRDDVCLIIFIKQRKLMNVVYIDRNKYDSKINSFKIFPKNHRFKLIPKSGLVFITE